VGSLLFAIAVRLPYWIAVHQPMVRDFDADSRSARNAVDTLVVYAE